MNKTDKLKKNEINMLEGPITGNLVKMALPLAAISILQQFFNAADVAVVGKFASSDAIAAVGANTPIINMFLTFFTGLSTGGNVTIASLIGMNKKDKGSASLYPQNRPACRRSGNALLRLQHYHSDSHQQLWL